MNHTPFSRRFGCLLLTGSLPVVSAFGQSTEAYIAPWDGPRKSAFHYTPPASDWTNSVVDSGSLPLGHCRAYATTNGAVGVEVYLKTDPNRGMSVYSGASAGVSDQFLLELKDISAYAQADSTLLRLRLQGALLAAPPLGWVELRVTLNYRRASQNDFEYGLLVLKCDPGSSAQWYAYNDQNYPPGKSNLFLHPLNRTTFHVGEAAAANQLHVVDGVLLALLPGIRPAQMADQILGFGVSVQIAGSGGRAAFYDTVKLSQANPVAFFSQATSVQWPLRPEDRFRTAHGALTPVEWQYPASPNPLLGITRQGNEAVVAWSRDLEQPFTLQWTDNWQIWTPVSGTPTNNGTQFNLSVPATAGQRFYRLRAP